MYERPKEFGSIKTYTIQGRHDLVTIANMANLSDPIPEWQSNEFDALIAAIQRARKNGRPVIFSMGAHVIKNGLSRYVIDLIQKGYLTHIAGNGACSIHDFELAFHGGTSEDVPTAIEDGSFGMWEETGLWMNTAIRKGAEQGVGYGKSLAIAMEEDPEKFPHRRDCILYAAHQMGIPATYHIALGTDIIHQHPACDFAAIGRASGADFYTFCQSVMELDGGVYMNFGSGVIGPEVFLKALSIARNLGKPTFEITTANFDLIDLGDFRRPIGYEDPNYYYRPRKNIVNRPTAKGGQGWHFVCDHKVSIPNLHKSLTSE